MLRSLLVFGLVMMASGLVHAEGDEITISEISYNVKDCTPLAIGRGDLRGKEICMQGVRCTKYAVNGPGHESITYGPAYCQLTANRRCPSADDCVKDDSISTDDMKIVKITDNGSTANRCVPPVVVNSLPEAPADASSARAEAAKRSQTAQPGAR